MPDDMYPEGDTDDSGAEETETEEGEETALLPRSMFGEDCKVGDEYTVKVVSVLEDELEVAPVKKEEKPEDAPGKSRMAMAGETLDMMES